MSNDTESFINDPLFRKISKFSRLEAEFQVEEFIGKGAFGDVHK